METNDVAFKISPYLLPIVVHELLPHYDCHFAYFFFLFFPIILEGLWGITDDITTIPFHHVLFSAVLHVAELAKSISVHSLTLKAPNKNCSRRHFNFLLLSFKENKA